MTMLRCERSLVMTSKRAAAYSASGLLLVAWFAYAGAERQPGVAQDAPKPVETSGTETLAHDVQAQAERLRTRLAAAPVLQPPSRNPFAFTPRETATPRERQVVETVAPEPLPPVEPAIELIGMTTSQTPNGPVRTAVISALSGELFLVKEGEMIATRYKVAAVAADTVQLSDLITGATRQLTLKN
jgi:hypothetical protein